MWRDGPPRRGAWRILLGVEDDAALARALAEAGRDRQAGGAGVVVGTAAPAGAVVLGGVEFSALPLVASPGPHVSVDVDSRVLMAFAAQLALLLRPPNSGSTP